MNFTMDHIVLNVTDMADMLNFYTGVLGLPAERLEAFYKGKAPFPSVRINDDTIIDLFPADMWRDQTDDAEAGHRLNHFCLTLPSDEWNAFRNRLQGKDVAIETGPAKRWGAHGTGISIYFRDPEGTLIEVRHYPEINNGDEGDLTS